jgi:hypothetical protein
MLVGGHNGLHFFDNLSVGKMVKLNRVLLWIEIHDRISADS